MVSWNTRKNERETKTHTTEWESVQSNKVTGGVGWKTKINATIAAATISNFA